MQFKRNSELRDLKPRVDEFLMLNNMGCLLAPSKEAKDLLKRCVKLAYCIDEYFKSNSYDVYDKVCGQFFAAFFNLRLRYVNEVIKANGK